MYSLKKSIVLLSIPLLISQSADAQVDVQDLVKSAPSDAQAMAAAYIDPLFNALGMGLATGWNNTAKVKKPGRFDIRIGGSGVYIPVSAKTFDVTQIGLSSHVRPADPTKTLSPTVGGDGEEGPEMEIYDDNGTKLQSFNMPGGIDWPMIPVPQIQASVGLPRGIGVSLRIVPGIKLGDDFGKITQYGGGIKLDIMPLIMGKAGEKLLPIDIAVAANYSSLNYKLGLDLQPQLGSVPKDANQSTDFSNQEVDATVKGMNVEVIVSKKLLFFTPFISAAYIHTETDAGLRGNYPIVTNAVINGSNIITQYTTYPDPVNIKKTGISGMRATIGFQLNLPIIRFYADYNIAKYSCLNAGIGFGIGK